MTERERVTKKECNCTLDCLSKRKIRKDVKRLMVSVRKNERRVR